MPNLTTFLSENQTAQQALEAIKTLISEIRDYGFVRIFTLPTFEELIAASQVQQVMENNDIQALVDIYPFNYPPEDSPTIVIGTRIGKRRAPTIEVSPGPLLMEERRVSFWINNGSISSIIIKVLEEMFVVKEEYKIYSLIAAYAGDRGDVGSGLDGLIVEDLEIAGIVEKSFTFSLYKWKSLPLIHSVAYTAVPYFHGLLASPEKVLNFLKASGIDIEETERLLDMMTEEEKLVNTLKALTEYLNNVSKRKREVTEILYEGVEVKEDATKNFDVPSILMHGFKQGSLIFLGVSDISLYHVVSLITLGKYYYKAEDLYLKTITFASSELPAALAVPKSYTVSGRRGTLLFLPEKPPSPTLLYRMVRDFGIGREAAHVVGFNASSKTMVPIDSLKRASLDVIGIIRRSISKGWKIDGGCLVKEDEDGREFKELLSS
ncbi:hypothetical protein IPA_04895 [Ignicoccus pacificus DSM 13166]|uniref:NurA domain-containing protein n=1 Tax=Ignicoccus pacificus DSM 13166 TaxID=940294 RepID=A0A977KB94_9CREN|nr:hypothetical protein IPA_04895 [Ignicoccus pacificus DSM 13166]